MVIAIVALLVSILLPALARAREQANRVYCSSHERQQIIAMEAYANDARFFPVTIGESPFASEPGLKTLGVDWVLLDLNYLEAPSVFQCPTDKRDRDLGPVPFFGGRERTPENRRSYAWNVSQSPWTRRIGGNPNFPGMGPYGAGFSRPDDIPNANQTILVVEQHHLWNRLYDYNFHGYFGPLPTSFRQDMVHASQWYKQNPGNAIRNAFSPPSSIYSGRTEAAHEESLNFGFADGHVEFLKLDVENTWPPFYWYHGGKWQAPD